MKKSIENLRQKIRAWLMREQRARRRKLQVVRLEDRRLPDASFGIVAGVLTLDGFGEAPAGGAPELTMNSGPDGLTFHLQNDVWDVSDLSGHSDFNLSSDRQTLTVLTATNPITGIQVLATGSHPLASVGDGVYGVQVADLTIVNGGNVHLDSGFSDFDTVSIWADSFTLHDTDGVQIHGLETTGAATIFAGGDITDTADADGTAIEVGGHANFHGTSITLGDHSLDETGFGSLTFIATDNVDITEDDSMTVIHDNSGHHVTLKSLDNFTLDGTLHSTSGRLVRSDSS